MYHSNIGFGGFITEDVKRLIRNRRNQEMENVSVLKVNEVVLGEEKI